MKLRKTVMILVLACSVLWFIIWNNQSMAISQQQMKQFMTVVDEASIGKVQVNWKNVAAIAAVRHDGSLADVSDAEINEMANLFIEKRQEQYTLRTMDEVAGELAFNRKQEKELKQYSDYFTNEVVYSHKAEQELNKNFIASIEESAIANYKEYGVLPSITISQAILESDWGRSQLAADYNNLFGIKDHRKWDGKTASLQTTENYNDRIQANFRAYDSVSESISDHGLFLAENPRYAKNGLFTARTYIEQAKALENAGYSTAIDENGNKTYSKILIALIRQYELQLIDSAVCEQNA
ncbi:MAG: glycoside hydrolase family 73 protein [Bacillus sp. (in: firmicutes)]